MGESHAVPRPGTVARQPVRPLSPELLGAPPRSICASGPRRAQTGSCPARKLVPPVGAFGDSVKVADAAMATPSSAGIRL
jgi:hypothetical protein